MTPPAAAALGCTGNDVATHIRYELTTDPGRQPMSRVISTTELTCAGGSGETLVSIAYVDGLGRARAALSTNDTSGGGPAWVRSGLSTLDKKGSVRESYQADFYSGSETDFSTVVALPPAAIPHVAARYDAFGRQLVATAEDGSETRTSYHSHSSDVYDPLDLVPGGDHEGAEQNKSVPGSPLEHQKLTLAEAEEAIGPRVSARAL